MKLKIREEIKSLRPYPPGHPIEEVKRRFGLKKVIKMASNENALGPSPLAIKAIRKELNHLNYYPDGNIFDLRMALAQRLKLQPQNLIFGNGSDELVLLIALTFLSGNDNIIISDKAFIRYEMAAQVMGTKCIKVPMKNFRHDLGGMIQAVNPDTRAIFFSNPNNPIGTMVREKEVKQLLKKVRPQVLVIIDEAYREYVTSPEYPDTLSSLKEQENLIILRSFSKIYGLAGLRIGYGIATPAIIQAIDRVRPPFNVNRVAQVAAMAALRDAEHVRESRKHNAGQKRYLYRELKRLRLKFVPSETNFILINVGQDSQAVAEKLLEAGIIVRPLAGFGMKEYIRVTIGKEEENQVFIEKLAQIIKAH